jgi:hypothetical protein
MDKRGRRSAGMTAGRCGFNSATSGLFGDEFWCVCGKVGLSIEEDKGSGGRTDLRAAFVPLR